MLHDNFTHYIGRPIGDSLPLIKEDFFGNVVVYEPTDDPATDVQAARLQVFVDDFGFIQKIVNG